MLSCSRGHFLCIENFASGWRAGSEESWQKSLSKCIFWVKRGPKKDVLPPSRLLLAPKASPLRSSPPSHREGPELHRRGVPTLVTVAPKCLILAPHIAEDAVVFTSSQGHSTGARFRSKKVVTKTVMKIVMKIVMRFPIQRSAKRYANLSKQDPGRGRQNK